MAQGRLVAGRCWLVRRQRTRGIYGAEHPDVRDYFADLLGRSKSKGHIAIGAGAIALSYLLVFVIRQEPLLETSNAIYLPFMIIQTVYPIVIYIKEKAKACRGAGRSQRADRKVYPAGGAAAGSQGISTIPWDRPS